MFLRFMRVASSIPVLPAVLAATLLVCGAASGQNLTYIRPNDIGRAGTQRELKLTDEQKTRIAEITAQFAKREAAEAKAFLARRKAATPPKEDGSEPRDEDVAGPPRTPEQEALAVERRAEVRRLEVDRDKAYRKVLTPEQTRRHFQVLAQWFGWSAFTQGEVIRALNLDPDKVAEIVELQRRGKDRHGAYMRQSGLAGREFLKKAIGETAAKREKTFEEDPQAATAELRNIREKYARALAENPELREEARRRSQETQKGLRAVQDQTVREILRILTKRQRETYFKLIGEPVEVANLVPDPSPLFANPNPTKPDPSSAPSKTDSNAKPSDANEKSKSLSERRGLSNSP